jgi:signal transduction histidine kinase
VIRLIALINDILDLERVDAPAGLPMTLAPTDLDVVVRHAAESVAAPSVEPDVFFDLQTGGLRVLADVARLEQVVINLLSNAVKFSPKGETVSVRCHVDGAMVRVEVLDRGPGVPMAFRPALFEPFCQAEGADNRDRGGSGLGLTISRAIIRQHGGDIGLEDREGGGSIFWFTLPLVGEPHA